GDRDARTSRATDGAQGGPIREDIPPGLAQRRNAQRVRLLSRFCTGALASCRSASVPIQRGAGSFAAASLRDNACAARFSAGLRSPMPRSAQLTPFLTKLRSSLAA